MTTTYEPLPSPTHLSHPEAAPGATQSPLARLGGPMALAAGALMTLAQLAMLPFDPKDHKATSQSIVFQVAGVAYLAGFCALLLALVGLSGRIARTRGNLGNIAVVAAIIGTMMLGGDLWMETFTVPWLADGPAPQVLESDPSVLFGLGAIASYLSFAIGWLLVGIAGYRARAFPKSIAVAIAIGGVLAFNALLAPFGLPLGLAIGALGVWSLKPSQIGPGVTR
jgi:hypothetical protein